MLLPARLSLPCWLKPPLRPLRPLRLLSATLVVSVLLAFSSAAQPEFLHQLAGLPDLATKRYGEAAGQRVARWLDLLNSLAGRESADLLAPINSFFNRQIRFDDDSRVWKQADFWATPLEALGMGAGDCEDFTIAKYITLRQLGVPDDKLRLIYVRAHIGDPADGVSQAHMVLGYYSEPNAEPLILDNLMGDILPARRRNDLTPLFSFNAAGLWVAGAAQPQADATARLSRWRDVLTRIRNEQNQ